MSKKLLLFGLLMVCAGLAQAQERPTDSTQIPTDTIRYIIGDNVLEKIEKQKEQNKKQPTLQGFRVQVYSGSSRMNAMNVRNEISQSHPEFAVYLIYKQPSFRVRVGDFKTRLEAQKLLNEVKAQYPSSFIVPDEVFLNPILPKLEEPKPDEEKPDPTDP